jgi:hypothetical protein
MAEPSAEDAPECVQDQYEDKEGKQKLLRKLWKKEKKKVRDFLSMDGDNGSSSESDSLSSAPRIRSKTDIGVASRPQSPPPRRISSFHGTYKTI